MSEPAFQDESPSQDQPDPKLSIIVVVHDMPEQARRTLHSLGTLYQRGVSREDYEVIVVENASPRLLGDAAVVSHHLRGRYYLMEDASPSPVGSLNFGVRQAAAPMVALMVDGARLLSPGVIATALRARRIRDDAVVALPGYHLGRQLQQEAAELGYDEAAEAKLLAEIQWPDDGYRLFDIACFSGSCAGGLFRPMAESNFLCMPRSLFDDLGGYEEAFDLPGGGYCNVELFARVCEREEIEIFVPLGEGTFHQFHGGVTTGGTRGSERQELMERALEQYCVIRGRPWQLPTREYSYFGSVSLSAKRFLRASFAPRVTVDSWSEQELSARPEDTDVSARSPDTLCEELESLVAWKEWSSKRRYIFTSDYQNASLDWVRGHGIVEPLTGRRFEPSEVSIQLPNIRESLIAGGLNSRHRGVLFAYARLVQERPHLGTQKVKMYAPEAISAFALFMRGRYPRFVGSEYSDDKADLFPIRNEDLHALTFADGVFDLVMAMEVFEHVHDLDRTLRELRRVLAPDGVMISTFPFRVNQEESLVRARRTVDGIEHLTDPEYHGDPMKPDEGVLVYEIPGWSILERTRAAGFASASILYVSSAFHGILAAGAGGITVMIARC